MLWNLFEGSFCYYVYMSNILSPTNEGLDKPGVEPKIWIADGFDLTHELETNRTPAIEIGGPTEGGYRILTEEQFSRIAPFLSNKHPGLVEPGKAELLDFLADGRAMPVRSGSVGIVLGSSISLSEERLASHPNKEMQLLANSTTRQEYYRYVNDRQEGTDFKYPDELKKEKDPVYKWFNQRIHIIEESARILVTGGLLIWQGGIPGDIKVAEKNGLEIKEKLERVLNEGTFREEIVVDCVFQKANE